MIHKMFSIRDAKAQTFYPPFYKPTHGEAEREFRTATNDSKTHLNQYPEDFDLYYVGEYDTNTGTFSPLDTPQHLMKAINCVKTQQAEV